MKKLKVKVFSVIFSLLTVFTLIIFVGGIAKDYMDTSFTAKVCKALVLGKQQGWKDEKIKRQPVGGL